jgi:hypothetical protein
MAAIAVGLHFEDHRAIASPAPFNGASGGGLTARTSTSTCSPGMLKDCPRLKIGHAEDLATDAHRVWLFSIIPVQAVSEFRHVETLVNLTLVRRAVAEIGEANVAIAAITVGENQPAAGRHLRRHDAMAPVKMFCSKTCAWNRPSFEAPLPRPVNSAMTALGSMPQASI